PSRRPQRNISTPILSWITSATFSFSVRRIDGNVALPCVQPESTADDRFANQLARGTDHGSADILLVAESRENLSARCSQPPGDEAFRPPGRDTGGPGGAGHLRR